MVSLINKDFNGNSKAIEDARSRRRENARELPYDEDTLLKNNLSMRTRIGMEKFTKAFTQYPARGLKGSKNSNFYEFLTMGNFPNIVGSLMLMAIFNSANRFFSHSSKFEASHIGNKMALGVLFYGLFKRFSKTLVNYPVKLATGIDTELPYAKVNNRLQEYPDDYDLKAIEYHKVGESVDFTYWDMLYGDTKKGESRNFRFDKIAKKVGLGENLNDSDQEVKPIYKEVLVKSKVAKSISTFLWAATGVALAFQKPWEEYFNSATWKFWKTDEFAHSMKLFGRSFKESIKELYNGGEKAVVKLDKHAGKALIGLSVLSTVFGVLNTLHITQKPSKVKADDVMDKNKECVVS
ncbi:MAG: hypothetical protein NC191_05810 [Muribaculaceae bacterium]|nr:hypothetical protein [Muribaculaceae bacterium]